MFSRKAFALYVLGVLAVVFYGYKSKQPHQIKSVEVYYADDEALGFYLPEDLNRITKSIESKGMQGKLKFSDVAFVDEAVVSKSLSGKAVVKVSLQRPVMSYFNRGVFNLVNLQGEVFSEQPQYKIPNLPVMRGKKFVTRKNREQVAHVFMRLPKEGVLSRKTLSEVLYDEDDMVFVFSGVNGSVFLDETEIDEKIGRLNKVIKYLRFHGIEAQALDARFKDRVVVSVKDKKLS